MPIHRMPIRRMLIIAAAPQTPRRMNPYFVRQEEDKNRNIDELKAIF
jgi:hypothetical protein